MKERIRIALYSHDTMGLGHVRRNLLIAQALASSALDPAILLIAGSSQANSFQVPRGVDSITLPAFHKSVDGTYAPRNIRLSVRRLATLRARTIRAALASFDPDLLIVDKVPWGALGELTPALTALKARGRARCVLGLRDVLDEPAVVRREWTEQENDRAIREHYSAIWVYGDRRVYDQAKEYRFSAEVSSRLTYTGYLDQRVRLDGHAGESPLLLPPGERILCTVGGGQDGGAILEAFAGASLPAGANGIMLAGPFMRGRTLQQVRRMASTNDRLMLLDFVPEAAELMNRADRVVTMGGYNTIAEVLSFGKRALVVPRVTPRREQLIRTERLSRLGLVDLLHPDRLTSAAISDWLTRDTTASTAQAAVDLGGLGRLPGLAARLLERQDVRLACAGMR